MYNTNDRDQYNTSTNQQSSSSKLQHPLPPIRPHRLEPYTTSDGFLLPSVHNAPPFFTDDSLQPNPSTQAVFDAQWTRIILSYAAYKKIFYVTLEDCRLNGPWREILKNDRIKRQIKMTYLSRLFDIMIANRQATYWPLTGQRDQLLIYWRSPEEWGQLVFDYVSRIGAVNTILTYDDIGEAPSTDPIGGMPIEVLRIGMEYLEKDGRCQFIKTSEGEGVRFLNTPRI